MSEFTFPPGFFWGAATSAHQVEGNNTNNDWWAWEQAGRVKEPSGIACDQYHRFRDDFDLAHSLGHNAHRLSVEWSRIEPAEGVFSDEALAHYREVMRALRQRQLEPFVTLHHFTNPLWVATQGGWTNPQVVDWFVRYVRKTVEALGSDVRYWLTLNEPMVYAVMHYLDGVGPPGEQNLSLLYRVAEHLVRAHTDSYHAIHEIASAKGWPVQVGIATHINRFFPCRWWWPGDQVVAWLTHRAYNQAFFDGVMTGHLRFPGRRPLRIPDGQQTLDLIGVNYYSRQFMRLGRGPAHQWIGVRCDNAHHREVKERNALKWEIYPRGIYEVLRWVSSYRRPLVITENGICTNDDRQRERFILNHLAWVARAIQQGLPILGYLYWSLLDNFEWAQGYPPHFGLIEVDYATQVRRVRASAACFAEICRTNRLALPV